MDWAQKTGQKVTGTLQFAPERDAFGYIARGYWVGSFSDCQKASRQGFLAAHRDGTPAVGSALELHDRSYQTRILLRREIIVAQQLVVGVAGYFHQNLH